MVSHDLTSLLRVCNRAVWMDHGQAVRIGPVEEVIAAYKGSVEKAPQRAA